MIVHFYNIVWDTDGEDEGLPVYNHYTAEVDDGLNVDMHGADVLSDQFGWCVRSFEFECLPDKKRFKVYGVTDSHRYKEARGLLLLAEDGMAMHFVMKPPHKKVGDILEVAVDRDGEFRHLMGPEGHQLVLTGRLRDAPRHVVQSAWSQGKEDKDVN